MRSPDMITSRRVSVAFVASLAVAFTVWLVFNASSLRTDDERYRDMLRIRQKAPGIANAEKGEWGVVIRPLGLYDHLLKRWATHTDALLETGYLTNVNLEFSGLGRAQLVGRLDAAIVGTDALICRFSVISNTVQLVCRPEDVTLLEKALRK